MIPKLIELAGSPWFVLPEGIHAANMQAIKERFAFNHRRRNLFDGLESAVFDLAEAGCQILYLDGSFVTDKPNPRDYDVCWDSTGVKRILLPDAFLDFSDNRAKQKAKYLGEFFPLSIVEKSTGCTFLEFFQFDGHTGRRKGILAIDLKNELVMGKR